MSDTPRTDEFWHERNDGVYPNKTVDSVIAFCRQIERERNELAGQLIAEFEHRAKRDHALANTQSGVVGFGVTASFAACWSQAADVVREMALGKAATVATKE